MLVLVNPRAGLREARLDERDIAARLGGRGLRAQIVALDGRTRVEDLLSQRDPERRSIVVVAGGDGTIRSVLGGLVDSERLLAVLPLGTRNHFARDAGIPLDLDAALEVLERGRERRVDVGQINDHLFLNNASLGLYPHFVVERRLRTRDAPRWVAIGGSATSALRHARRLQICVNGEAAVRRASIVFVGNNRYTLEGLRVGTRPSLEGGVLSLVLASPEGWAGAARLCMRALLGRLESGVDYEEHRAQRLVITIHQRTLRVGVDGEPIRIEPPLELRSRPGALRLLVPRGAAP